MVDCALPHRIYAARDPTQTAGEAIGHQLSDCPETDRVVPGREDQRKLLFDRYIGYNDPAEFFKAQEAIKKERLLIQEQKAK